MTPQEAAEYAREGECQAVSVSYQLKALGEILDRITGDRPAVNEEIINGLGMMLVRLSKEAGEFCGMFDDLRRHIDGADRGIPLKPAPEPKTLKEPYQTLLESLLGRVGRLEEDTRKIQQKPYNTVFKDLVERMGRLENKLEAVKGGSDA
jgi:hypothetical protein